MRKMSFTSTEVKNRWKKENYRIYQVQLRIDDDKELIKFVEDNKEELGTTNIFRDALTLYVEQEKGSK